MPVGTWGLLLIIEYVCVAILGCLVSITIIKMVKDFPEINIKRQEGVVPNVLVYFTREAQTTRA